MLTIHRKYLENISVTMIIVFMFEIASVVGKEKLALYCVNLLYTYMKQMFLGRTLTSQ